MAMQKSCRANFQLAWESTWKIARKAKVFKISHVILQAVIEIKPLSRCLNLIKFL